MAGSSSLICHVTGISCFTAAGVIVKGDVNKLAECLLSQLIK